MIKAENITKSFFEKGEPHTVLHGVSLEVPEGQFLAIMGRSGAGKSTLLYQLSLLDKPTDGKVILNNIDTSLFSINKATSFRLHNLGFVFQEYALLPELSAKENVAIPLIMQGFKKQDAFIRAHEALEKVSLGYCMDNLPSQMSGGEQQRVSIARAIVNKPAILFADEPTANLDFETSRTVMDTFTDLNKNGQTIVMVTHEEDFGHLAQRLIKLSDGRIISDERIG